MVSGWYLVGTRMSICVKHYGKDLYSVAYQPNSQRPTWVHRSDSAHVAMLVLGWSEVGRPRTDSKPQESKQQKTQINSTHNKNVEGTIKSDPCEDQCLQDPSPWLQIQEDGVQFKSDPYMRTSASKTFHQIGRRGRLGEGLGKELKSYLVDPPWDLGIQHNNCLAKKFKNVNKGRPRKPFERFVILLYLGYQFSSLSVALQPKSS